MKNNSWDVCFIEDGCQSEYETYYTKEEMVTKCEEILEKP